MRRVFFTRPGEFFNHSTGLGLVLCKQFIEQHGGQIWVESEPGVVVGIWAPGRGKYVRGFGVSDLQTGMTNGWLGYTGGLEGYHTSAYYLPEQDATLIVLVNSFTGMANVMVHDLTAIVFPDNVAFSDGGGV